MLYNQRMKNNQILKNITLGFLAVGVLSVLYSAYLFTHKFEIARESQLASLLGGEESAVNLNERVKFSDCETKEPLPDPDCTPGAIFEDATKDKICISGYSTTVRNVSTNLKKKVFAQYGIEYPVPFGSYEVDHLVPLSLGGSNDVANLWPKSADPVLGFFEKNVVANYLHEEVCDGKIALSVAQEQIAKDWTLIYKNIDPETVRELKIKYPNWADRPLKKK